MQRRGVLTASRETRGLQVQLAASVHRNGQFGAWSPRQPQWQHWGELADVGQGAESTAQETGIAPVEGIDACGCDEGATERETQMVAGADACMVG